MHSLTLTHETYRPSLATPAYLEAMLEGGLRHVARAEFPASTLTLDQMLALGEPLVSENDEDGVTVVVRLVTGQVVMISRYRGTGQARAAARTAEAARECADEIAELLTDGEPDGCIDVTFWSAGTREPESARRQIEAPDWADIRDNYAAPTRAALDELMSATEPGLGGLVLWHGEPGTGKSFAIRALGRAWRDWCALHVVTDHHLLLGGQGSLISAALGSDPFDRRHRLFVLEDAAELVSVDAPTRVGTGSARLLNLTDGMLGAGLKSLVLVTTNEPLGRVNPAVARPGRCWSRVGFDPLSVDEANAWLAARGDPARVARPTALADLYVGPSVAEREAFGFSAAA